MKLKLLVVAIPLLLDAGGCTVHFPLGENGPSLSSQDDSSGSAGDMSNAPTEPSTHDFSRGNTAPTPDLPQ
jgi:hypothetical protein